MDSRAWNMLREPSYSESLSITSSYVVGEESAYPDPHFSKTSRVPASHSTDGANPICLDWLPDLHFGQLLDREFERDSASLDWMSDFEFGQLMDQEYEAAMAEGQGLGKTKAAVVSNDADPFSQALGVLEEEENSATHSYGQKAEDHQRRKIYIDPNIGAVPSQGTSWEGLFDEAREGATDTTDSPASNAEGSDVQRRIQQPGLLFPGNPGAEIRFEQRLDTSEAGGLRSRKRQAGSEIEEGSTHKRARQFQSRSPQSPPNIASRVTPGALQAQRKPTAQGRGSVRGHIRGFPSMNEPLPPGLGSADIIMQYPNHLRGSLLLQIAEVWTPKEIADTNGNQALKANTIVKRIQAAKLARDGFRETRGAKAKDQPAPTSYQDPAAATPATLSAIAPDLTPGLTPGLTSTGDGIESDASLSFHREQLQLRNVIMELDPLHFVRGAKASKQKASKDRRLYERAAQEIEKRNQLS